MWSRSRSLSLSLSLALARSRPPSLACAFSGSLSLARAVAQALARARARSCARARSVELCVTWVGVRLNIGRAFECGAGVPKYAAVAAFEDGRFNPISLSEIQVSFDTILGLV